LRKTEERKKQVAIRLFGGESKPEALLDGDGSVWRDGTAGMKRREQKRKRARASLPRASGSQTKTKNKILLWGKKGGREEVKGEQGARPGNNLEKEKKLRTNDPRGSSTRVVTQRGGRAQSKYKIYADLQGQKQTSERE